MPTLRDNREVNKREFQQNAIRTIIDFLQKRHFDKPFSTKILASPTAKEFRLIITFILQHIDSNFELSDKAYEEEIRVFFKLIGYPFSISRTALQAIGSPHTWPSLLAAMEWAVVSITIADETEKSAMGPTKSYMKGDFSEFFEPNPSDRAVFGYMSNFYNNWMKTQGQEVALEHALESAIEQATLQVRNWKIIETVTYDECCPCVIDRISAKPLF